MSVGFMQTNARMLSGRLSIATPSRRQNSAEFSARRSYLASRSRHAADKASLDFPRSARPPDWLEDFVSKRARQANETGKSGYVGLLLSVNMAV